MTTTQQISQYISQFAFSKLCIEVLGWNYLHQDLEVSVQGTTYPLVAIAEKAGHGIYLITTDTILPKDIRYAIERAVTKLQARHLLIFTDGAHTQQIWQHAERVRGEDRQIRVRYHERPYFKGQSGEALAQILENLGVSLEEEDTLTGMDIDVKREALAVERVTKKFYNEFQKVHKRLTDQIIGMEAAASGEKEWYASLMLNRLMFTYFIQKKHFLADDPDYLKNKLQALSGSVGFYSFYRSFLLKFFHDGLGRRSESRKQEIKKLIGDVPYLNGGLFEPHPIEKDYENTLDIPDPAFVEIFDLFDGYHWHLDTREARSDREINPDVLGYIFEKYVNQKQMGAYYTKEDITGYISKNTIIPFLFNHALESCRTVFDAHGPVWSLLKNEPDRYIYPDVRHGIVQYPESDAGFLNRKYIPLPDAIATGVNDITQRGGWNGPAPEEYGLPTETWREHVARRQRYDDLYEKLTRGEVTEINDLITYNLNINLFARDVIQTTESDLLIKAFYEAITQITVLDPTCGSGAFLFAALNVLEPLYEACIDAMENVVNEDDARIERDGGQPRYKFFRENLEKIGAHAQSSNKAEKENRRRYFIYKSIIISNLYGVDIMEEAAEIAKLRLFLKLVSQIDSVERLEPLPDIDFNIRAGNTLVGYARHNDVATAVGLDLDGVMAQIDEKAERFKRALDLFRDQQTILGGKVTTEDKNNLYVRMTELNNELDRYLASQYGIEPGDATAFATWRRNHQPFHWYAQFHGIMQKGGFDVVIGNPPYLDTKDLKSYKVVNFKTIDTRNLYSLVIEQCQKLTNIEGRQGYIVPVSSIATEGYLSLQRILLQKHLVCSSYDDRPSHLFDGLDKNTLSIILLSKLEQNPSDIATTRLLRWGADAGLFHFQRRRPRRASGR